MAEIKLNNLTDQIEAFEKLKAFIESSGTEDKELYKALFAILDEIVEACKNTDEDLENVAGIFTTACNTPFNAW